jgi:hypothetical protein
MVDFALSRMLGLYVVARLAQRYDIKVQLRHSWYGGITALVLLPPTVAVRAPTPEAIEAPSRRGPAELVASSRPAEPAAEAAEENGDHLPIFEAARSDWFEDGVRGDHLPLRRHAAQQPMDRGAEPTGNGAGADAARAEALRAEAMRVETARMEAARAADAAARTEPAPAETPPAEPSPAGAPAAEAARPGDGDGAPVTDRPKTARTEAAEAREAPAAAAARPESPDGGPEAAPRPAARSGRQRGDGAATRAHTGPLPTRTPGASGPPPGGAKPFAPAPPPGAGQPVAPAPAAPPAGRSSRRAGGAPLPTRGAAQATAASPATDPAPATLQAASVQTTKAGLPRRVPRANLAPGMVAAQAAAPAASPAPGDSSQPSSSAARSPDEVRSMLSSYRSGLERGRMMAAGEDADRGGDAHSSSRSDDDATQ